VQHQEVGVRCLARYSDPWMLRLTAYQTATVTVLTAAARCRRSRVVVDQKGGLLQQPDQATEAEAAGQVGGVAIEPVQQPID